MASMSVPISSLQQDNYLTKGPDIFPSALSNVAYQILNQKKHDIPLNIFFDLQIRFRKHKAVLHVSHQDKTELYVGVETHPAASR